MEFERDAKGRDIKITFFNAAGKPAANGEGVYGYKLERDDSGRIIQLVNLGRDGQPSANRAGLIAFNMSWGKGIESEVRDAKGQPARVEWCRRIVTEYDSAGNAVRVTYLGTDGKPVRPRRSRAMVCSGDEAQRARGIDATHLFQSRREARLNRSASSTSLTTTSVIRRTFNSAARALPASRSVLQSTPTATSLRKNFWTPRANRSWAIKVMRSNAVLTLRAEGIRIEETYFDAGRKKLTVTAGITG